MSENSQKPKVTVASLARENAQMKADIATVISVFTDVFQSFGLTMDDLGGGQDMMSLIARAMPKISMKLATGGGDAATTAKLQSILPIITKYTPLAEIKE